MAERRLAKLKTKIDNLSLTVDAKVTFSELAAKCLESIHHTIKPSTFKRMQGCVKNLTPFFSGIRVRNTTKAHCEKWVVERGPKLAPLTFAHELMTMKSVFRYAVEKGFLIDNPAAAIKRKKIRQAEIQVPTRDQFQKLIAAIRFSDGRTGSQAKAQTGAELVEVMAYSGCRVSEATSLVWSDIDFEKNVFTVRITKNGKPRTVPMTPALRSLLDRLKAEHNSQSTELIVSIKSARKCLETACRRLGFPVFTHHDFRHFFATTCIEAKVDIPTISRWLGHSDGGALAMRIYGHLREEHSRLQAQQVDFSADPSKPKNGFRMSDNIKALPEHGSEAQKRDLVAG